MWAWRIGRPHPQLVHGGRARHREVPRTPGEQPSKAQGKRPSAAPHASGRRRPMPTRAEAPRPRPVWASRSRGQPAAGGCGGGSGGQPARPESSLQGTGQRVQPNASMPREGAPKSSRRHVGLSLGSVGASSSSGLRRRGPLRGARGGGPSAGCMKRRFGGERLLLSTVAATIAMTDAGAFTIAAETVA